MAANKTLSVLRTRVRNYLDESTASFWSNAQINLYLQDAVDRVNIKLRQARGEETSVTRTSADGTLTTFGESYAASSLTLSASGTSLSLPFDYVSMRNLRVTTTDYEWVNFQFREPTHPDWIAAKAITTAISPSTILWNVIGARTFQWVPLIDTALALAITYERRYDLIDDDADEISLPIPLDQCAVHYAVASCMLQDRDPNAAVHETRAKEIFGEYVQSPPRDTTTVQVPVAYGDGWV